MLRLPRAAAMILVWAMAYTAFAADPAVTPPKTGAAAVQPTDWAFTPDPKLPNVLILGDSISIGYTRDVRSALNGKANVYRPMAANGKGPENCSGTTRGVQRTDRWIADPAIKWSVIHFNFGLHDLKHTKKAGDDAISKDLSDPVQADVAQYSQNLEAIVQKLKGSGARLIFATTTPCPETSTGRTADEPPKYNEAALGIVKANGIEVDDLYGFVLPNEMKWQLPNNVHFTKDGYHALGEQVAKSIEQQLAPKK